MKVLHEGASPKPRPSCFRRGCLFLLLGGLGIHGCNVAAKEWELAQPNVWKNPSRTAYAQILPDRTVRFGRLPCGNVLTPPPCLEVAGRIESVGWRNDDIFVVDLAKGGFVTRNDCGIRVIVRAGGKPIPTPPPWWKKR